MAKYRTCINTIPLLCCFASIDIDVVVVNLRLSRKRLLPSLRVNSRDSVDNSRNVLNDSGVPVWELVRCDANLADQFPYGLVEALPVAIVFKRTWRPAQSNIWIELQKPHDCVVEIDGAHQMVGHLLTCGWDGEPTSEVNGHFHEKPNMKDGPSY